MLKPGFRHCTDSNSFLLVSKSNTFSSKHIFFLSLSVRLRLARSHPYFTVLSTSPVTEAESFRQHSGTFTCFLSVEYKYKNLPLTNHACYNAVPK